MKIKKNKPNVICGILIFAFGTIFGKLIDYGYFTLTKEISIIEAITLLATIGVAIYIAKVLEKEMQDNRIEKELYLNKIADLEINLNKIELLLEEKDILYTKINSNIEICRIKRQNIFENIKDKLEENEFNSFEKDIKNKMIALKRLLTETPIEQNDNSQISINKNIVKYSQKRINQIIKKINSINEILFRIKIRINNL